MNLDAMFYLFAAYGTVWLLLFGYLWLLHRRQRGLERELERLQSRDDG